MKTFISYSSKDKNLAGQIKHELEEYGLDVFLAHEDITPSEEWVDVILAELKACDIFLPLLTKSFEESKWVDQESGIAFFNDKLIIPLKYTKDPYGFISRFQALKVNSKDIQKTAFDIIKIIASKPVLGKNMRDIVIQKLGGSWSFDDAAQNAEIIVEIENYSMTQIKEIIGHVINNDQIHKSWRAQSLLKKLVKKYRKKLEPKLLEAFDNAK